MRRLRALWQSLWVDVDRRVRLGRGLGLVAIIIGFVVIAKAWDGAASINFITGQLPYLLSGGFLGLGLVVTGAVLLLLATVRAERQLLTEKLDQVTTLLGRNLSNLAYSANGKSTGPQVVSGATVYHLPECKILQGKEGLATVSVEQAAAEGLSPCRVCNPPEPAHQPGEAGEGSGEGVPGRRVFFSGASEKPAR